MNEYRVDALFVEPNAYITRDKNENRRLKKIVFQEPYENMPNHYINNNFQKKNCDCVPPKKSPNPPMCGDKQDIPCFDFSSLSNLFANIGNMFSGGFSNLISMLGKSGEASASNGGKENLDIKNLLSLLGGLQGQGLGSILNLFKGRNKTQKSAHETPAQNSSEIPIKNYTRVE